jgi:NAD-dependent deacetylase
VKHAKPGRGHRITAALVNQGKALGIITQNIDGLHVCDGLDPSSVIELHGNGTYAACLSCSHRHELDWVEDVLVSTNRPPRCVVCRGVVKSATISFGQPMPEQAVADAKAMTLDADLFLALGSSLQVYPAAGLPVLAAQNGTPLVIVNREPTGLDGLADLVINADIGDTLTTMQETLAARIS